MADYGCEHVNDYNYHWFATDKNGVTYCCHCWQARAEAAEARLEELRGKLKEIEMGLLHEHEAGIDEGIWIAIQELVWDGADTHARQLVHTAGFTVEECRRLQSKSGSFNDIMAAFIKNEIAAAIKKGE